MAILPSSRPGSYPGRLRSNARILFTTLCVVGCTSFFLNVSAQQMPTNIKLAYDDETRSVAPIPPSERMLQTVVAEPWFKVSNDNGHYLEGLIFDRSGNLLFTDMGDRRILRLTPDKQLLTVIPANTLPDGMIPTGLALHPDGRLFIATLDFQNRRGAIFAVNLDGDESGRIELHTIIPPVAGYMPNDLVFDTHGGFYFTDFKGDHSTNLQGSVNYVAPDFMAITPVLPHLTLVNGLTLSPDGTWLWASEGGRNRLYRIKLADATTVALAGSVVAYHFVGPAPDTMRADVDGNVYVAINGQGRVLVFNRNGIPIGQVLLPGRAHGRNLASSSLAIHPDQDDLYIVSSDPDHGQNAAVFHARAFNKGVPPAALTREDIIND